MPTTVTFVDRRPIDYTGDGITDTTTLSTVTETYDDFNNLTNRSITADTDGDGVLDYRNEAMFSYDAANNLIWEVAATGGPAGSFLTTSTRAYDALGRKVAVATDIDLGGDGSVDTRTIERFTYDELGQQATQTVEKDIGADGTVDERSVFANAYAPQMTVIAGDIDNNGDGVTDVRFTVTNTYDEFSRLLTNAYEADSNGDGVIDYRETVNNTYDEGGRVLTETRWIDRNGDGVNDFTQLTSNAYDAAGQIMSSTISTDTNGDGIFDEQTSQSMAVASVTSDALFV